MENPNYFSSPGSRESNLIGSRLGFATTITPTNLIHHVVGIGTIENIIPPWLGFTGPLTLILNGPLTWNNTGNIATPGPVLTPQLVGQDALYGYWNFDEVSGTRVLTSGSGPDLLEVGGTVLSNTGIFNLGISSNKVDTQYLQANITSKSFPNGFTFAIWFYLADNPSSSPSGLVTIYNSAGTDTIFLTRYYNGDYIEFAVRSPTGNYTSAAIPGPYTRNAWHLVICWWDAISGVLEMQTDNGPIYNRDFLASSTVSMSTWDFDRIRIGLGAVGWHGRADDFYIWERPLTPVEREQLFGIKTVRFLYDPSISKWYTNSVR